MSRKLERKLIYITGIWQILDGLITILFYGMYQRNQFSSLAGLSFEQAKGIESIFGSIFMFISIFGTLLMGLGMINLVTARNYMKDHVSSAKVGIWLLVVGIFSYFIMDIVSLVLTMTAAVLYLAKNKSIRMEQ